MLKAAGRRGFLVWVLWGFAGVLYLVAAPSDPAEEAGFVLPEKDPVLQRSLERLLTGPPFRELTRRSLISVAVVDLTDASGIRYAGVAEQTMRYAASLPKIAILLGAFDRIARGQVAYTKELSRQLTDMIRFSNNPAATDSLRLVGFRQLGLILQDPRLRLYDPGRGGGLWVGKDYGGGLGYGPRDPLHGISHGANAEQVARFLVMMERGELISPWASAEMKEILSDPGIRHKFVKGLEDSPGVRIFRKSGTWRHWHCDAALVEHQDGRRYVAVGLIEHETGGKALERLIRGLDDLILAMNPVHPRNGVRTSNPPAGRFAVPATPARR